MNQIKTCRICLTSKPIQEFPKDPTGKLGVRTECKPCYSEIAKARYRKNPEGNPRQTDGTKKCSKCRIEKPVSNFLSEKKALDGLKAECGDCFRARARDYSRANTSLIRQRRNDAMTEEMRLKRNQRAREKYNSTTDEQRLKHKARLKVNYRVRKGKMKMMPCEVCGNPEVEAHHEDYSKTFEVKWLCEKHHKKIHRKYE